MLNDALKLRAVAALASIAIAGFAFGGDETMQLGARKSASTIVGNRATTPDFTYADRAKATDDAIETIRGGGGGGHGGGGHGGGGGYHGGGTGYHGGYGGYGGYHGGYSAYHGSYGGYHGGYYGGYHSAYPYHGGYYGYHHGGYPYGGYYGYHHGYPYGGYYGHHGWYPYGGFYPGYGFFLGLGFPFYGLYGGAYYAGDYYGGGYYDGGYYPVASYSVPVGTSYSMSPTYGYSTGVNSVPTYRARSPMSEPEPPLAPNGREYPYDGPPGKTPSYRYDGGPANPVPMPVEPAPKTKDATPKINPADGRIVKMQPAPKKYSYAAYGQNRFESNDGVTVSVKK